MVCSCIHIYRNKSGKIIGYAVRDFSGNTRNVTPEDLKAVIKSGQLQVSNLTLASDGRLVAKKEQNFKNTNLLIESEISESLRNYKIIDKETFDKWYLNFLNKIHSRVGGNMRLMEEKLDNGYIYNRLRWRFENIKRSCVGTHHIDIIVILLPTRVAKVYVELINKTGENILYRIGELSDNLYCQENIKVIEKTTREFLKEYNKRLKGC